MADYYEVLGVERSASSTVIRMAYKRLAMKYHPDHNQGDKNAEEVFKLVNEAYHTLSDPIKKSRYDARMHSYNIYPEKEYDPWEERRRRYYKWQHAQQNTYKVDREYFRIQGLAFLVFIVIAGFCFAVIHAATYFAHHKREQRFLANSQYLKQVNTLFISGRFDDAFSLIDTLRENDPQEYRFYTTHDSLVSALRQIAEERFKASDFAAAVTHYRVLKNYEDPPRFETLQNLSLCQYYLGNYAEALQALKHLHNQQPNNLQLIYSIGIISLEKMEDYEQALQYFTLGKDLFKKTLSQVYGEAFMLVMNPADAPDIYFDIFHARAQANAKLHRYQAALQDCTWSTYLRPNKADPYVLRAMVHIKTEQFREACQDLNKAKKLGAVDLDKLTAKYCR
ncbi:MAG TPA: DnaJ domain-containing protein [Ohtaekwangia sp.]|nr:DnaJ domain-containing protein [Ohtaekwangia sp.]